MVAAHDRLQPPASAPTLALDARVEGIAAGTRLLVDDAGGATTLVTVTASRRGPQTLGGADRLGDGPDASRRRSRRSPTAAQVTVYELVGPSIPFWGYAYPERLTGGTVLPPRRAPRRRHDRGRADDRRATPTSPASGSRVDDVAPRRTVLVGDAATDPVAATIDGRHAVRRDGRASSRPPRDATSARRARARRRVGGRRSPGLEPGRCPRRFTLRSPAPRAARADRRPPRRTLKLRRAVTTVDAAAPRSRRRCAPRAPSRTATRRAGPSRRRAAARLPGRRRAAVEFMPDRRRTRRRSASSDSTHDQAAAAHALRSGAAADAAHPDAPAARSRRDDRPGRPADRDARGQRGARSTHWPPHLRPRSLRADPLPGFRRARARRPATACSSSRARSAPRSPSTCASTSRSTTRSTSTRRPRTCSATSPPRATARRCAPRCSATATRRRAFQRFALKKAPLTYVPSASAGRRDVEPRGARSTACAGTRRRASTARPRPPQVYATRTQDDGTTVLQFGDGRTGATRPDRRTATSPRPTASAPASPAASRAGR